MQPVDYCPNSRVHLQLPLTTPTRAVPLPNVELLGTA